LGNAKIYKRNAFMRFDDYGNALFLDFLHWFSCFKKFFFVISCLLIQVIATFSHLCRLEELGVSKSVECDIFSP